MHLTMMMKAKNVSYLYSSWWIKNYLENNNEPIEDIYDDDGTLMFSKDMNDVEEGIKNTRVF